MHCVFEPWKNKFKCKLCGRVSKVPSVAMCANKGVRMKLRKVNIGAPCGNCGPNKQTKS